MNNIDFPVLIPKFDAILSRGLCRGVGDREGQMCIEAAICAALDLPHGDEPECVAEAVRDYKIVLNDRSWSSPQARAKGLRDLGIAQIGSKGVVDDTAFREQLATGTIRVLIPTLFREIFTRDTSQHRKCREAADRCERDATRDSAAAAADSADSAACAAAAAAAAYDAASAAADSADSADSASAPRNPDKYLLLSAQLALDVLRDLNSPGCAWIEAVS